MDHPVFAGNLIPGWLTLPRWCGDLVAECAADRGCLRHRHDKRLVCRQVLTEALTKFRRIDPNESVAIGCDVHRSGRRRCRLGDLTEAFTSLRCEGSDID